MEEPDEAPLPRTRRAKNLIYLLLEVDPRRRLTATQALQHAWITQAMHTPADLSKTRDKLRSKEERSRFKARAAMCPYGRCRAACRSLCCRHGAPRALSEGFIVPGSDRESPGVHKPHARCALVPVCIIGTASPSPAWLRQQDL